MLSEQTRTIVKATVPVLEQHGTTITKTFYANMLSDHTELLNIFNRTNQKIGAQPTALATTVLAAAKHIDDLSVILGHVRQIAHKHRALQIFPEHYPIVGKHLLGAIRQVLGEAATDDIINAWAEAYGAIADVFIQVEAEMYREAAWSSWAPFRVTKKELVASDIYEFVVVPTEDSKVDLSKIKITPGHYITVNTHPTRQDNEYDALRHYSISSANTKDGLRFAVRLETSEGNPPGLVSEFLHRDVKIGDVLKLSAPAGDFELTTNLINQNEIPLVLVSAGSGVTPLLAMLEQQINANPARPIVWLQSAKDSASQAFTEHVKELLEKAANSQIHITHTKVQPRISAEYLSERVPSNSDVYICGPLKFMQAMIDHFSELKHQNDMIHYEPFGPKMSTVKV